jgi:hypothetical protein
LLWLQRAGLDNLDAATHCTLLARYASDPTDPYSAEIASWLRGDYRFDPLCLTT